MSIRFKAPPPSFLTEYRTAMRRARSIPLSRWIAQRAGRPAGTFVPSEMEMGVTADFVVYEEREPRITPTGILDSRGMMLLRVTVPIKEEIGFVKPRMMESEPDEVETILPEDYLAVSDCGLGVGFVTPEEVEGDEDEHAAQIRSIINAVLEKCDGDPDLAKEMLAELGLEVEFTPKEDASS